MCPREHVGGQTVRDIHRSGVRSRFVLGYVSSPSTPPQLLVPKLEFEELAIVWAASPLMERAYREGTEALRKLLRSPFNLFLLANVLSDGPYDLGGVTTQIQLLHLYWSHRVIGNDLRGIARQNLLRKSLDQTLEGRILRVPFSSIQRAEAEDLYRLNSNGVFAPAKGGRQSATRGFCAPRPL
jgi:hypothetical protein